MSDESRKQFEQWASGQFNVSIEYIVSKRMLGDYLYSRDLYNAWCAWVASRAALVVDIASHTEFEIEHMISPEKEGYSTGWIDGRNYSVKQVCAAGITIKGEGDE